MKNSRLNFLCFTYIPEIFAQIFAGAAGYIHFVVGLVSAVRAFPHQLAVSVINHLDLSAKAAYLTVITLCI